MSAPAKNQKVFRISSQSGNSMKSDRSNFHKIVKSFSRTREKVRKNWRKSDNNQDDFIRDCEDKFSKHHQNAVKLQKELRTFINKMREVASLSKNLHETVLDIYEDNWISRTECAESARRIDNSWIIYLETLTNLVQNPLEEYLIKFSTIRPKIEKRQRKVMDYDVARRKYEHLVRKKPDPQKLDKARQDYEEAGQVYKNIASELYEELPKFYDERLDFYCNNWRALFSANKSLHQNIAALTETIVNSLQNLETVKHQYVTPRIPYDPEAPALGSLYKSVSMHSLNSYNSDSPISSAMGVQVGRVDGRRTDSRTANINKTPSAVSYLPINGSSNLMASKQHYSQFDLSETARSGGSRAGSVTGTRVLDYRTINRHKTDSLNGLESQTNLNYDPLRKKSNTTVGRTSSSFTDQNSHRISEPSMELLFPKASPAAGNSNHGYAASHWAPSFNGMENGKSPGSISSGSSRPVTATVGDLPPYPRMNSSPPHYTTVDNISNVSSVKSSESYSTKPKSHSQPPLQEAEMLTSTPNDRHNSNQLVYSAMEEPDTPSVRSMRVTDRRNHHNTSPSQIRSPLATIEASPNVGRHNGNSYKEERLLIVKFNYNALDPDELSLTKGDILKLTDWENPELQEDGWLFGIRISDNARGLFPENHTTPYNMNLV